jgi:hypothetical protein
LISFKLYFHLLHILDPIQTDDEHGAVHVLWKFRSTPVGMATIKFLGRSEARAEAKKDVYGQDSPENS